MKLFRVKKNWISQLSKNPMPKLTPLQMAEQTWRSAQIEYRDASDTYGIWVLTKTLTRGVEEETIAYVLNDLTEAETAKREALSQNLVEKAREYMRMRDVVGLKARSSLQLA